MDSGLCEAVRFALKGRHEPNTPQLRHTRHTLLHLSPPLLTKHFTRQRAAEETTHGSQLCTTITVVHGSINRAWQRSGADMG